MIFLVFFRVIKISINQITIWKPIWFLGRNRIDISEISVVKFKKVFGATYSMTEIEILDKEGCSINSVTVNWIGFEKRRLINKMVNLGIRIEIIE
ncbi:hypothetical protein [Sphingobacterium humi]|uniref:Uncharacterized protein n=1 Tax=Sphingobacterium humi TaxID=1796905 RepID=A0A6N8L7Q0_9SPHI|nr:hypothetical protein [Sphingobacterium humi]MVZ63772.1 hypothetical protein [Sphingobacterium humi]